MVAKIKRKLKRRSLKSILISSFFGIFILLVIFFLFITNWRIYQKKAELRANLSELEKELKDLENRNEELKMNISYIQSNDYLEQVARDQLHMKKPGEEVVVIQKEEAGNMIKEQEDKSWWDKIKSIFTR